MAHLTTSQAAKRLGEHRRTIARWCEQGVFPGARRRNPRSERSHWQIPVEAIEKFEQEREGAS